MPRILVLDDEPLIAMMVEDWLMDLGHEIVGPAHSVASALSLLEQSAPDAAILEGAITGRALYDGRIDPAQALGRLARVA